MAKYHISPSTGNPNKCYATKRPCPVGGASEHFGSKEEARQAYEAKMDEATGALQSVQREIADRREAKQAAERANVVGLEVVNRETGLVETFIPMSKDELEMPGYLEHVEKGYEGTKWDTRRTDLSPEDRAAMERANAAAGEDLHAEAHCFVCNRHTDHFAEHDGLVEAGLAEYRNGSVYRTAEWDDGKAKAVAEAEYQRYLEESVADAFGDQVPEPVSGGKPMSTYNAAIGDEYVDEDGYKYRVTGKSPAGSFGVAESAGPGVKLTRLKEDGALSGYTRTVQHGGYYKPEQYTSVPQPLNGFQEGKTSYESAVIAFVQKKEFTDDPQGFLKSGRNNMVRVIVPNVGRLTDKRRLEIGREAWKMSGRTTEQWDAASEEERLRWTRSHMGRYDAVEVEVADGRVGWSTSTTSGTGYSLEDVRLLEL